MSLPVETAGPARGSSPGRWLLVVWTLGALAISILSLARELGGRAVGDELVQAVTLSEAARIERALGRFERRQGWPEGHDARIWCRINEHVPPDGSLYVVGPRNPRNQVTFSVLQVLGYPRRFHELPAVPPREATTGLSARDFVLELGEETSPLLPGWFELVADEPDFRLWRHPRSES